MCRLFALTFTDLLEYKASWTDRLFLVSQTDEGQNDGWGITDGNELAKTQLMYSACTPLWMHTLAPTAPWMGHVRKASAGTGRTLLEAHPYQFDVHGASLYCAHNGKIDGTVWNNGTGIPNTDSYRAFLALSNMMNKNHHEALTTHLLSEWLKEFTDTSQLAMLFHYHNQIVALRKDRSLHHMRIGNGYAVHTSKDVLEIFKRYIKIVNNVDSGDIVEIPTNSMTVFEAGSDSIVQIAVDIQMRTYWKGNTVKNEVSPAGITNTVTTPKTLPPATDGGAKTFSTSVTRPKKEKNAQNTETDEPTRLDLMSEIVNYLSPLRQGLVWFWTMRSLGYTTDAVTAISTQDLKLWRDMLPRYTCVKSSSGEIIERPYTTRAYMLINQWNHVVARGKDLILHDSWLGDNMFWMLPRYLDIPNDGEAQALLASDLARYIAENDLYACWSLGADIFQQVLKEDHNIDITKLQ
jgi:predicted glutamine amidotransferase